MKKERECRMCGGKQFKKVINMGKNPLVNSLIEKEDLDKIEPIFPLAVEQCQSCWLVQIVNPIDSHKIYRGQDYLYYSGDMPGLKDYFSEYAMEARKIIEPRDDLSGKFVVEIGSNDGIMLQFFKNWNAKVLGVDPSTNVVVRAVRNGISTLSDFFSERLAKSIVKEFGQADLIYGNNCIAHLRDLHDLMRGVKLLLKPDGVFAIECNYWGGMVENKNYALIYHDHFSYFSLLVWQNFLKEYGLQVFDAWVTPAQGGSLRMYIGTRKKTERLLQLERKEAKTGLNSSKICVIYRKSVKAEAKKLNKLITLLKNDGKSIAGYGAAAKGFSVLKLADIDQRHIDYFVDDSPAKQGKYTPVTHIPVISREEAESKLPDYFFITAPNYEKVIVEKESNFRERGGKFITVDCRVL